MLCVHVEEGESIALNSREWSKMIGKSDMKKFNEYLTKFEIQSLHGYVSLFLGIPI